MEMEYIKIEFSDDSIFGSYTSEDVDQEASAQSFMDHLEAALDHEYPGVEFNIERGINDRHSVDGQYDSREAEDVGLVINKVWESFDWLVGLDEDVD
jgi:hypothetical protein